MPDFAKDLDAEIVRLRLVLDAHPLSVQLRDLLRLRESYYANRAHGDEVRRAEAAQGASIREANRIHVKTPTREMAPETRAALEKAKAFLAGKSEPVSRKVIYDHLVAQGCRIGGRDPVNTLSAMLARSSDFVSHGKMGWTLAAFTLSADLPWSVQGTNVFVDACLVGDHNGFRELVLQTDEFPQGSYSLTTTTSESVDLDTIVYSMHGRSPEEPAADESGRSSTDRAPQVISTAAQPPAEVGGSNPPALPKSH